MQCNADSWMMLRILTFLIFFRLRCVWTTRLTNNRRPIPSAPGPRPGQARAPCAARTGRTGRGSRARAGWRTVSPARGTQPSGAEADHQWWPVWGRPVWPATRTRWTPTPWPPGAASCTGSPATGSVMRGTRTRRPGTGSTSRPPRWRCRPSSSQNMPSSAGGSHCSRRSCSGNTRNTSWIGSAIVQSFLGPGWDWGIEIDRFSSL